MQQLVGQSLIVLGLLVMAFGVYTILRLQHFYSRLVITSKVEVMGFIIVLFGTMILTGFSLMTLKIFIIFIFELVTLPIASHAIARSAYANGFRLKTVSRQAPPGIAGPGERRG